VTVRAPLLFVLLLATSCATYLEQASPTDKSIKPPGEKWWCSIESSGMLSVCERKRVECMKARRFLQGRLEHRGENIAWSPCKEQKYAYCYTATRKTVLGDVKPPKDEGEDEKAEAEPDDDAEPVEDGATVTEEIENEDSKKLRRRLKKEKVWLCHDTPINCEANRQNMYQDGFADVSRCRRWK